MREGAGFTDDSPPSVAKGYVAGGGWPIRVDVHGSQAIHELAWFPDQSQGVLGRRYKSINLGADKSPDAPKSVSPERLKQSKDGFRHIAALSWRRWQLGRARLHDSTAGSNLRDEEADAGCETREAHVPHL